MLVRDLSYVLGFRAPTKPRKREQLDLFAAPGPRQLALGETAPYPAPPREPMRAPAVRAWDDEMIVDGFAGGGGASLGIEQALGRSPDVAINHDPDAIAIHAANHPRTHHLCGDIWDAAPRKVTHGRPVGLLWISPDCKHHSRAKGGKPRDKGIRALAWVAVRWAREVRPRIICCENVLEFQDWGPLLPDGMPDPAKRGWTFRRWIGSLQAAGYAVEWRELRACDYGAPTIRKRLFLIARCDGEPIVWPAPTHGRGLLPYRTAAECIDWHRPCPSIFERKKPLAEKTLARVARGIFRFVLGSAEPFIVPVSHGGDLRVHSSREPLRTVTGHEGPGSSMRAPIATVTETDHHSLVASHMVKLRGSSVRGQEWTLPAPTVTAGGTHLGEVRAFLTRYNTGAVGQPVQLPLGSLTTARRFGVVTVEGTEYEIADIGLRMLVPRELFRAQDFPDSYVIDPVVNGKPLSLRAQVSACGNSVNPCLARAIVGANVSLRKAVAA